MVLPPSNNVPKPVFADAEQVGEVLGAGEVHPEPCGSCYPDGDSFSLVMSRNERTTAVICPSAPGARVSSP